MAEDVKIGITTPGAQASEQALRKVAAAEQAVGREGADAGSKVKDAGSKIKDTTAIAEEHHGVLSRLVSTIKGLVGAYLGLAGVRWVLNTLREETERVDAATRKATESLRGLLAMSALKGERAEVQQKVLALATERGVAPEEMASAYYALQRGTAGMDTGRRDELMRQAAMMAKTAPGTSLEGMTKLFATIATQQPQLSPEQIGNLVSTAVERAGATPEEAAGELPVILRTARAAGVEPETAAAMFSLVGRKGGGVEASAALRAAMLAVLEPSAAKDLQKYGFPERAGLAEKLQWLGTRGGALPPEMLAGLGGRRAFEAVSLLAEPGALEKETEMMRGAVAGGGSVLEQRLRETGEEVPSQRWLEILKQAEVASQVQDIQPDELREQAVLKMREALRKKRGQGPVSRALEQGVDQFLRGVTGKVVTEFESVEESLKRVELEAGVPFEKVMEEAPEEYVPLPPGVDERIRAAHKEWWEKRRGREPVFIPPGVQQSSVIYQGGTHFHGTFEDPAGRAIPPANYYG